MDEQKKKVTFKIQGKSYEGVAEESLLGALRRYGYDVPSLCYHEAVSTYGSCRLCLVEVQKGRRKKLTTSCNYPVQEGIEVFVDTEKVIRHRKVVLELLLAVAPASEHIRQLAGQYGVDSTPYQIKDPENQCILCGLCSRVCHELVSAHAIDFSGRGTGKKMTAPYDETAEQCIGCGACVYVCPTDCIGIKEENNVRSIMRWHRDLPMKPCKQCGRAFAPTFQLMRFAEQINKDRSFFDQCPDCRK